MAAITQRADEEWEIVSVQDATPANGSSHHLQKGAGLRLQSILSYLEDTMLHHSVGFVLKSC